MLQTTIRNQVHCTGIGLHKGEEVTLTLRPAPANSGILFHIAGKNGIKTISPTPESVIATGLATTLGTAQCAVSTVEHLLAALRGLGIDNIHIDVAGNEIPILDGSAAVFAQLIAKAGVATLTVPKKVLRIKAPLQIQKGDASIKAMPYNGFFVDYTINFPHSAIGTQRITLEVTPETFAQIASARTFGFLKDVEAMRAHGLALGGSLENSVVLDENGVMNPEGLRYTDEFVRHKLLDFIGDMAMLPLPLQGKFIVRCSGHALNNQLLREAWQAPSTYLEEIRLAKPPFCKLKNTPHMRSLQQAAATA